jgi:phosphatidylglycerophosphatase A
MTLARFIATVAYVGTLKPAPGTWGSAVAMPFGWLIARSFGLVGLAVAIVLVSILGVWAASAYEQASGAHDPAEVVIDEVAGQWIALLPVVYFGGHWLGWLAAFAAFRLFDIWKPGPIGKLDRNFQGGFGTMIDDIAAGACAALLLGLIFWLEIL